MSRPATHYTARAGYPRIYKHVDPVDIWLSLVMISYIAFGGLNGGVVNLVAQQLRSKAPSRTMMVTLTNEMARSGCIPSHAAPGYNAFEVVSSRVKPASAENGIVKVLLDFMHKAKENSK